MNNIILSQIDDAQKKMGAYIALLNYRYMNLCVKADIAALLPVSVYADGEELNIEDVANVNMPDEYQLGVYPKEPNDLQPIIQGIYEAHPEFKMEINSVEGSEDEASKYVLYTMPDVDKNRHDFLINGVKGLYEECQARVDAVYANYQARFAELLVNASVSDADEANKALDEAHNKCDNMVDELLDKKTQEIEDAYKKYLTEEEDRKKAENVIDFTKNFRMFNEEEEC
jgi:ribosome recycling factor